MQHEPAEIAIVGVGQSDFRALYAKTDRPRDAYALAAGALRDAIEDCGIDKDEIDGLLCCRVKYDRLGTVVGLKHPRFVHDLEGTGRMSGLALQEAVALIASGTADVVACVYGNNGRSAKVRYGGEGGGPTVAYDEMYGMTSPGAYVGLMYQRYRGMYGAGDDALAPLAINNRRHAALNPVAVFQDEFTRDDYLNSRYIAEPLRLLDYCLINDGAVAFIVTSMERARSLRKPPVRVAATAGMAHLTNHYTAEDFFYSACQDVAGRLYRQAGIAPEEVDCLQIYDNFTPTILFTLEGFDHAPRGEAWSWVDEKKIHYDGSRPLNTAGGHTSESYMQGWAHHVESVRQLRGEAGARQVPGCATVQYMCASPIVTSHILTNDEVATR
ncbi:thiolase family protein [Actinomadura meridiana]|uniref:Thiolase family protein n=1 Tax=Actinomadura meridiana TaxID=559626 RepID=A0ABP8CJF2_9ACTN